MLAKKVYFSEKKKWASYLAQSHLLWPFFPTHSEARLAMECQIKQQNVYLIEKEGKPWLFIYVEIVSEQRTCVIKNALSKEMISPKKFLQLIEQFARQTLQEKLILAFSDQNIPLSKELFIEAGYIEENSFFEKRLVYKLGLVFGGGGSHGSYQIGVWQALQESNLPVQVVTGTSVGALNGALYVQGDLEAAKDLWNKLSTEQVLVFPAAAEKAENLAALMAQIASLTRHALMNRGVSAEPLRTILEKMLSFKKMDASEIDFSFTATRIRGLKEITIQYKPDYKENWLSWLMASASFFPAMEPQKIAGELYMDGGYRNNLPLDLAYQSQVTDCFIVDVKGPGLTKPIREQAGVNHFSLHSPWSLGSFLLFSPKRSQENLCLGYLETLKVLDKLQGFWYSFLVGEDLETDWQSFYRQFKTLLGKENSFYRQDVLRKIRKYYKDRVVWEKCGQIFLELSGKYAGIRPTDIYTHARFKEQIRQFLAAGTQNPVADLSISEWLDKYYQELVPLSDFKQIERSLLLLKGMDENSFKKEMILLSQKAPLQAIFVAFLFYIERGML